MSTPGRQNKNEASKTRKHRRGDEQDIEHPAKKRMTERIRSSATASIDMLRDLTIRLSGLDIDLDANVETSKKLFDLAHFMYEVTLGFESSNDTRSEDDLNIVIENIFSYEKELEDDSEARKMAAVGKHREKIRLYREELGDAWIRYLANTMSYLLGAVHRLGAEQRQQDQSHSIPLDRLCPILPTYLATYVGHEEEVKSLVHRLVNFPSPHVIILGGGGMGKTALATKGMYDPRVESKFGNCRFFIDCDGVTSAEGIIAALVDVFKVVESQGATKQQALFGYFRTLHTSMLLVLDNLESAWDTDDQNKVEAFLSNLCSIDLLAVVVTMRGTSPPQGPLWHQKTVVKPLPPQDSYILFLQIYPQSAAASEPRSLRELLKLLDGLPLAITLMASVGVTGYSPSELLAAYRNERTAMLKRGRGKDRLSSLEISITISIHCQTMVENPDALRLLEVLSLLPDGLHDDDRPATLPSMTQYSSAARILVQVALCSRNDGITRILAPIRAYVQAHHPPSPTPLHELRQYHFLLALRGWDWNEEPRTVMNEVGPKMSNIQTVLKHAMDSPVNATSVLSSLLGLCYFSYMACVGDCKPALALAISAYETISHSQNEIKILLAHCTQMYGQMMYMRYDYEGATKTMKEARATFEVIGDRLGVARCTQHLGKTMQMQYDYDGATAALNEAKTMFEDLEDHLGAAQCTRALSEIMRMRYDYDGATVALKEAKALYEDIGNRLGATQCTQDLGKVMQMRHNYEEATVAMKEARVMFADIGELLGAAQCTQSLGEIMRIRDDYGGATAALMEAKVTFEDLGELLGAAQCTRDLGDIMKIQEDYDGATAALKEAKATFEDIGSRRGAAQCTRDLGQIMHMRYDYAGATTALKEAKAMFEEARAMFEDSGDRLGASECTMSLGEIMLWEEEYDFATATLKEAKEMFEGIGERLGAAECTMRLGQVMQLRYDYAGAAACLKEAKKTFEDIGSRAGATQCKQILGEIEHYSQAVKPPTGEYAAEPSTPQSSRDLPLPVGRRFPVITATSGRELGRRKQTARRAAIPSRSHANRTKPRGSESK